MGLMIGLLTLPLAPIRGVTWIAEQIRQEADRQWSDPAQLRAQLADIQALREAGAIEADDADQLEEELVQRLLATERPGMTAGGNDDRW